MSKVITDKFKQKLLQKEFDNLYYEYVNREPCLFFAESLKTVLNHQKVKVVEFYSDISGYINNRMAGRDEFLGYVRYSEWDYEFIGCDVLRISITSSFWFDIYFSEKLTDFLIEEYSDYLEEDVINNYRIMDDYCLQNDTTVNRLSGMQDEYYYLFGEELLPSEK